ncbi:MAG: hypothetical protein ACOX6Y_08285 [Christensenellales bacterium]|jgi:hypothetical protein
MAWSVFSLFSGRLISSAMPLKSAQFVNEEVRCCQEVAENDTLKLLVGDLSTPEAFQPEDDLVPGDFWQSTFSWCSCS